MSETAFHPSFVGPVAFVAAVDGFRSAAKSAPAGEASTSATVREAGEVLARAAGHADLAAMTRSWRMADDAELLGYLADKMLENDAA